ncbi:MAG: 2-oxoacid:acceptor oxidoreductase family protein [Promethearchaeota archaeon]
MADIFNVLIAGVGGQGVILMGNLLREFGLRTPLIKNVVGTESRGVSQREGSVISTIRYLIESRIYSLDQYRAPEDLISPIILMNDAHLVLGLEPLETIRNLRYISEKTVIIMNTRNNFPKKTLLGGSSSGKAYPSNAKILEILDQFARKIVSMDFSELSQETLGEAIFANSIILGVAVKEFREVFRKEVIMEILKKYFGEHSPNIQALEMGYQLI